MTAVIFKFQQPSGDPVVGAPFTVTLRKPTFDEMDENGILLPGAIEGVTDAQGECTLELAPGYGTYYLSMMVPGEQETPEGCIGGLRYKFIVPESPTPVRVEALIVTVPTWSRPWDEQALLLITEAKVASQAAAVAAEASAVRADAAAESIEGDADRAEAARDAAEASKNAAAGSAQASANSAAASSQSAADALASKNAAAISANAANNSAVSASNDAGRAATSEAAALASKNAAAGSATAASGSATTATNAAASATASKDAAAISATTATTKASEASTSAGNALTQANRAKTEADRAVAATDGKQDKNGNLTALSALSGATDRMFYFTSGSAMSVAPFTAKARALLARSDTAGMQAELGLVPVTNNIDVTPGRLVTPGWMGIGGNGVTITASDAANSIRAAGNYYASGPVGTPENYGFLQHFNIGPNDAGQEFLSILSGKKYSRVLSSGTWSGWKTAINQGDFGIGSLTPPSPGGFDTPGSTLNPGGGFYVVQGGASSSEITYASMVRIPYTNNYEAQMFFPMGIAENKMFFRVSTGNSGGNFGKAQEVFHTGNVTKDPSTRTGLMSSTVINGFTVSKFINGQCHVTGPLPNTPSVGAGVYSVFTASIPSVLVAANNPVINVQSQPSQVYDSYGVVAGYIHAAASGFITTIGYAVRNGQTAQEFSIRVSIWGTWI